MQGSINGSGFQVQGAEFRVQGAGFRVWGLGFNRLCRKAIWMQFHRDACGRVEGSGFRVRVLALDFAVLGAPIQVFGVTDSAFRSYELG